MQGTKEAAMGAKRQKAKASDAPARPAEESELPERWSAQRKCELVLRVLRGETLCAITLRRRGMPSRGRARSRLTSSRAGKRTFLETVARGLKSRVEPEERELTLARAKIGELMITAGAGRAAHRKKGAHGGLEEIAAMNGAMSPSTGRRYP
jgi:hypothetical protein